MPYAACHCEKSAELGHFCVCERGIARDSVEKVGAIVPRRTVKECQAYGDGG